MDNATKRNLRQPDAFQAATGQGIEWANAHRNKTITAVVILVLVVVAIVGGVSLFESRSAAAETAFGSAMQTYQTPLVNAAQPLPPGMKSFPNAPARANQANAEFLAVAHQYGLTKAGKLANYFAGLTYLEAGKTGPAEDALKSTASSWDSGLSALGKSALAQLYAQEGQNDKAIDLYNQLAKSNATTVPAGLAQLQLAELYQAQGKTDQARKIYADLKDHDKDTKGKPGTAAEIATAKLNPSK